MHFYLIKLWQRNQVLANLITWTLKKLSKDHSKHSEVPWSFPIFSHDFIHSAQISNITRIPAVINWNASFNRLWMTRLMMEAFTRIREKHLCFLQQVHTVFSLVFQNMSPFLKWKSNDPCTRWYSIIVSFIAVTWVITQRFFPERRMKHCIIPQIMAA